MTDKWRALFAWRVSKNDEAVLSSLIYAKDVGQLRTFLSKRPRVGQEKWLEMWERVLTKNTRNEDSREDQIFHVLQAHKPMRKWVKAKTLNWALSGGDFYRFKTLAQEWKWTDEDLAAGLLSAIQVGVKENYGSPPHLPPEARFEFAKQSVAFLRERGANLHCPIAKGGWANQKWQPTTVWKEYTEQIKFGLNTGMITLLESWNDRNQLRAHQQVDAEMPKDAGPAL